MRTKKDTLRLEEIEEMLSELLAREEARKEEYGRKMADYEIRELQRDLEKQADAVRADYPDFDEEKELENEVFKNLVLSGLDMKTAYEAVHLDELKAASEADAKQAEERDTAKKKTARPEENGSMSSGGALFKSGVYGLSKKDRAELARRAQKGEIIRF